MNLKRSRFTAVMALIVSLLALGASLTGLWDNSLYADTFRAGTISKFLISGSLAQDIISIPTGLVLLIPALGIIACQLFRGKPFGQILAGIGLLKVLTVCLSVAFAEWFVPLHGGYPANISSIAIFSTLTVVSLVLFILYMVKLDKEECSHG